MGSDDFDSFFRLATDCEPYPYQRRWAMGNGLPALVSVPTGLGKTAGAVLAWLWRRRFASNEIRQSTPRRLVYCLPMRVLVEQTHASVTGWLQSLGLLAGDSQGVGVHLLMGGDVDGDWDRFPERDAILIGTQDQLLSRALNRGYAMSRFRWPMQFGLINTDCHWVMDEVQLMGNGLATTAQLQAFRRVLGTCSSVTSTWMSATMRSEWLGTVDLVLAEDAGNALELDTADRGFPQVLQRLEAAKPITGAGFTASKDGKAEAQVVMNRHQEGTLTLVVVNTVKRAATVHAAVGKEKPEAELVLVHSRFRPNDRKAQLARLLADPGEHGTIAVTTQVVEAGVDVSASTLITDLAPWPSLVQRFGRCNRYGSDENAAVIWIDVDRKKTAAAPYEVDELEHAAGKLNGLTDVGPASLPEVDTDMKAAHVIRRRDIIDLFDTTPDLAGADIDVSRFIRENDEHHVQVFWRNIDDAPTDEESGPRPAELCSVSITDLTKVKGLPEWRWDHLEKGWVRIQWPSELYPGLVLMLRAQDGCYSPDVGWTGKKKDKPEPLVIDQEVPDHNDDDRYAQTTWQTLAEHTDAVVEELERLLSALPGLSDDWHEALRTAARWHDAGKAHPMFQSAMLGDPPEGDAGVVWAKTARRGVRYKRRGFRHELGSALAMLAQGHSDLAAYLAAAHHGKVRLSIRSLPHETCDETDPGRRFARGIWDGETLPETDLGDGTTLPETPLNLSLVELGNSPSGPSWLARTLTLRDDPELGPFRIAYLEVLLRVADWRASARKEPDHA